jgi:predicted nucleic acid-binding protein
MILLDSDMIIDFLRGYQPAREWFASVQNEEIGLPGFVAMELIQGCKNAQEQKHLEKVLAVYTLYWAKPPDCARAFKNFSAYHLSHQLGLLDSLIAETAIGFGAELATFNIKHYGVLKELKTVQPYKR